MNALDDMIAIDTRPMHLHLDLGGDLRRRCQLLHARPRDQGHRFLRGTGRERQGKHRAQQQ